MIPDNVNRDLIPNELLQTWAQAVRIRITTVLQAPGSTLGHLEAVLEAEAKNLLRPILAAATQRLADQQPFQCARCHAPLRAEARHRPRTLHAVFGALPLRRDYGWCPRCEVYGHPADAALGLHAAAAASPRVQEMAALISLRSPYAQAAQDARRLSGLALNSASLQRETLRQGQQAIQCRQDDLALARTPAGVAALSARSGTAALAPFTLIIEMDAWNIRERDDWGRTAARRRKGQEPERWHWVYTGTLFRLDQRGQTPGGRRVITQRGYVATRQSLDAFKEQLYAEALLRGLLNAEQVLIIADGAIWIWNLAADRFKDARQRVDLYHVKEHLHELARTVYGPGTPAAQQWLAPLLRFLEQRTDGVLDVLRELAALGPRLKSLTEDQQAAIHREIGYFTTHHKRMDYKQAKAKGEPVGSGAVESTARQYQTRFKATGQFWSLEGDEALLALATLYRNERWSRLFPHSDAATAKQLMEALLNERT
jgi:hypothetical protein